MTAGLGRRHGPARVPPGPEILAVAVRHRHRAHARRVRALARPQGCVLVGRRAEVDRRGDRRRRDHRQLRRARLHASGSTPPRASSVAVHASSPSSGSALCCFGVVNCAKEKFVTPCSGSSSRSSRCAGAAAVGRGRHSPWARLFYAARTARQRAPERFEARTRRSSARHVPSMRHVRESLRRGSAGTAAGGQAGGRRSPAPPGSGCVLAEPRLALAAEHLEDDTPIEAATGIAIRAPSIPASCAPANSTTIATSGLHLDGAAVHQRLDDAVLELLVGDEGDGPDDQRRRGTSGRRRRAATTIPPIVRPISGTRSRTRPGSPAGPRIDPEHLEHQPGEHPGDDRERQVDGHVAADDAVDPVGDLRVRARSRGRAARSSRSRTARRRRSAGRT